MKNLSKKCIAARDAAVAALEAFADELEGDKVNAEEYCDERSERWQQSDKGADYREWVNDLDALLDKARELATDIEDLRESPSDD